VLSLNFCGEIWEKALHLGQRCGSPPRVSPFNSTGGFQVTTKTPRKRGANWTLTFGNEKTILESVNIVGFCLEKADLWAAALPAFVIAAMYFCRVGAVVVFVKQGLQVRSNTRVHQTQAKLQVMDTFKSGAGVSFPVIVAAEHEVWKWTEF
jgi:hypothetical protein